MAQGLRNRVARRLRRRIGEGVNHAEKPTRKLV